MHKLIRLSSSRYCLALLALAICSLCASASERKPDKNAAISEGRRLFKTLQCASCHSVNNVGGCIAPPLDDVTKRRSANYLKLRLDDTKEDKFIALINHPELFPHPRFKPRQVDALIAYLGTLSSKRQETFARLSHPPVKKDADAPAVKLPWKQPDVSPSAREGRRLFLETGCMACHSVGTTGGTSAPALDGIGTRHSRRFIESHITDPVGHLKRDKNSGRSKMIQPELAPDQVKAITDFLLTLPPPEHK